MENTYQLADSTIVSPLLTVAMLTYNHENYIAQAIESVLMQQCNFEVHLMIAEDCSTDNTRKIIEDYQKKYPEKIILLLQQENKGASTNANNLFANIKGKYIAMLEGDDYWTDPLKLQKQVDFMEANEDFALVCTQCNTTEETRAALAANKEIFPYDILHHNPISTLTVLFRRNLLPLTNIPDSFKLLGDYPRWLAIAQHGRIMKLKDNTAYYRILLNSASHRGNKDKQLKYQEEVLTITRHYLNDFTLTAAQRTEVLTERLSYVLNYAFAKGKITCLKYYLKYFSLNKRILKQVIFGLLH